MCKNINGKIDNMYKLYVWKNTGSFYCHRCGNKGSWFDFKRLLGDLDVAPLSGPAGNSPGSSSSSAAAKTSKGKYALAVVEERDVENRFAAELQSIKSYAKDLSNPEFAPVRDYLGSRGFGEKTLKKYHVGATKVKFQNDDGVVSEHMCVTFPWTSTSMASQAEGVCCCFHE